MIRKFTLGIAVAAAALVLPLAVAFAAVIFDASTGTGFVGKGDVQLVYGWNNPQLQNNASSVQFRSIVVTERSWVCTKALPVEVIQEKERTTTTTQLVNKIDRVRNQITGFILTGYTGDPATSTEGPPLNSCPASSSGFVLTPAGDPVVVSSAVDVSTNGTIWYGLN